VLTWLNTSGAPVLLAPRSALPHWRGILLQEPRSPDAMVDFVDEHGGEWFIHDAFDFAKPRTDYDRLCGALAGHTELLVPLGDAHALAISDGCDTSAWWREESIVLTGGESTPRLDALTFSTVLELEVHESAWVLMNSAVAGVQVLGDDDDDEWQHVTLRPGRYRIERASRENGAAYRLVIA
jgi:hypothetical protein